MLSEIVFNFPQLKNPTKTNLVLIKILQQLIPYINPTKYFKV